MTKKDNNSMSYEQAYNAWQAAEAARATALEACYSLADDSGDEERQRAQRAWSRACKKAMRLYERIPDPELARALLLGRR